MTKRRLAVLLAGALVAAVGGLVYSRTRGPAPDDTTAKADDTPPPAPVTKATTPARKLNEKERMLVGKWKLERATPSFFPSKFSAEFEYMGDGTCLYVSSSEYHEPRVRRGTFQVAGDTLIVKLGMNEAGVSLIEELTTNRFVQSASDEGERTVKEWSRVQKE